MDGLIGMPVTFPLLRVEFERASSGSFSSSLPQPWPAEFMATSFD